MIRAALRTAAILVITASCSVAALVAGAFTGRERAPAAVMSWWGRTLIRLGGWTVRVEGLANLPHGGAVVASNHQSLLDIPLLVSALGREVRFLAKRELARVPVFGPAMARAGNLFVDREDPRDAVRLVREAVPRMERGELIVVFPEGTRSADGTLGAFREGAFFLAQKTGAPLVPVLVDGGRRAMPKGSLFVRAAALSVRVMPPLPAAGRGGQSREEMAASARRAILAAQGS